MNEGCEAPRGQHKRVGQERIPPTPARFVSKASGEQESHMEIFVTAKIEPSSLSITNDIISKNRAGKNKNETIVEKTFSYRSM